MPGLTALRRTFGLAGWVGLPPARARSVRHLFGIAATLAAAKVILATVAVTLFVSEEGAAGLPFFYVTFAPLAILLSFGLGGVIDRAPKIRLAQIVFAVLLIGSLGLRLLPTIGIEGAGFALLAAATVLEIVVDVVFWVVVAAYLDAFEVRRATTVLYMGLAVGGAAGGVAARVGLGVLAAADILVLLVPLAVLVVVQLQAVARRLDEVPENHPHLPEPAPGLAGVAQVGRLLRRYPLALLIALNALVVTLLYGLSEFLILSIYEERFAGEAELAAFLSVLFAVMQIVEFALLFTLTRVLLERTGPLLRNLAFPMTSLGALGSLLIDPRLATAVAVHVNIEAASNALFLPVHNANYIALPLGFQGRARILSEGVFYPIGLALAGAVLWGSGTGSALLQAEFATFVFVLIFLLVSAGVGLLFLPTLLVNARTGLPATARPTGATTPPLPRVKALLRSRDPALCGLGLALAGRLDATGLDAELRPLADRPNRAIRTALAGLIGQAPEAWRDAYLDDCLTVRSGEAQKLALLVLLTRRAPATLDQMRAILRARDPSVAALGRLALDGAAADLEPWADNAEVASELVGAAASAGRTDLALLLLAEIEDADPEQLRRALALVRSGGARPAAQAEAAVRRLLRHRDGPVRAEAAAALGEVGRSLPALRSLAAMLIDPDARVRAAAAIALVGHGDRAAALLRGPLRMVTPASVDAVRALAGIDSPRARRLLVRTLRDLLADTGRTDRMLQTIVRSPAPMSWVGCEVTLREHRGRLSEIAVTTLLASVDPPLARHLRSAFAGPDQRSRAHAFELLAASRAAQRMPEALGLLRYLMFEGMAAPRGGVRASDAGRLLREMGARSAGPWVRRAAYREAGPGAMAGGDLPEGDFRMAVSDQDFEHVIVLKRIPLFRALDLDLLLEVARAVSTRSWLRGDEIVAAGSTRRGLLILEMGKLGVDDQPIIAPACFGEPTLAGQIIAWPRITALEDSRVGFLNAILFEELQRAHPEMAVQLSRVLARRVHELEAERVHRRPQVHATGLASEVEVDAAE